MTGRRGPWVRMFRHATAAFFLLVSACATSDAWRREGLTEEILFQLEEEDWGVGQGMLDWPSRARSMGVPVDVRPIAVREATCRSVTRGFFECDYLVDYGRNGVIEGTYRRRYAHLGKENGVWSNDWIIVT